VVRHIRNRSTRRAYENAIGDFMRFTGINRPEEFRTVTRAHVIAWRDGLGRREDIQSGATVRHRLAALSKPILSPLRPVEHFGESRDPRSGKARMKAGSGIETLNALENVNQLVLRMCFPNDLSLRTYRR
jgi:hypothetical protein